MAYPSPYRAGMASLGFQWIIHRLREAGIAAERAFLPEDLDTRIIPLTYESLRPLSSFPILGISLAYELELAGLIRLLRMAGIPPLRRDRRPSDPVILLGGPLTFSNPLPAAPFVDAMLLGEADETAVLAAQAYFDTDTRETWLDAVAALPGGFVPERHGTQLPAVAQAPDTHLPARSSWLAPDAELSSMFLLEGERGCHRMCSFCVMRRTTNGGMRLVSPERILSVIPTEARKVGLVGAAISDHPLLVDVLKVLVDDGRQVSLSSLRADRIERRPAIAALLRRSGARSLTVASDAASRRLRRTIAKGTTEQHLLSCAEICHSCGYDRLKVYMMLGLPGEEESDIEELIAFSLELAKRCQIAIGVAPFVAKRNTPLDGYAYAGISTIDRRLKLLTRSLRGRVVVRPTSARWAWVEYELAQGGPEAGEAVYQAVLAGGRFADYRRHFKQIPADSRRPWA